MLIAHIGNGGQTAEVSWWPKRNVWESSGFNCGHWTVQCEEWFTRRVADIAAGVAKPRTAGEWRKALRLRSSVTRTMLTTLNKDRVRSDA